MVHTFQAIDNYYLLDTESGSVFLIDYTAHILARKMNGEDVSALIGDISAEALSTAQGELDGLVKDGLLFTEARPYSQIKGGSIVKALCLNVSHACNLRCKYCFADDGTYGEKHSLMPYETAKNAIDFLIKRSKNRHNLEVDFFGGEPLLNFDVVKKTVEYAKGEAEKHGKDFKFTITTNGILLNKEIADYINKEFFNVVISIDGREDVHNEIRISHDGKDYYKKIVDNALMLLSERGEKSSYIRGTITGKHLDFSKDVKTLADIGFKYISLEPVVLPDGHSLAIKQSDLPDIFSEYEKLARLSVEYEKKGKPFDFFHFRIDLEGAPCREKLMTGCGAGCQYLAVSPSGDIYPCHQYDGKPEYVLGNVNDKDVVINSSILEVFEGSNLVKKPECSACWAKYYCGGGCNANSDFLSKGGAPYKTACDILKKRTELAIALYCEECGKD